MSVLVAIIYRAAWHSLRCPVCIVAELTHGLDRVWRQKIYACPDFFAVVLSCKNSLSLHEKPEGMLLLLSVQMRACTFQSDSRSPFEELCEGPGEGALDTLMAIPKRQSSANGMTKAKVEDKRGRNETATQLVYKHFIKSFWYTVSKLILEQHKLIHRK